MYIPLTLGGVPVTGIADNAFKGKSFICKTDIPDTVTWIGKSAFSGCKNLEEIDLHEGIDSIGDLAFNGCQSLLKMVIPASVDPHSGSRWFDGCTKLKTIELAEGTTEIGQGLRSADGLTKVVIPGSVTKIGNYAFESCYSMTSVVIPDAVTSLGWSVFSNCYNLRTATLGKEITAIGDYLFDGCEKLSSVKMGDQIRSIGTSAFYNCKALRALTVPSTVTSIGSYAFAGSGLRGIVLPDALESLGDGVFYQCYSLKEADLGSVTGVPYATFYACSALSSVDLGENVKYIYSYAFSNSGIESITLSNSVSQIYDRAFSNCKKLYKFVLGKNVNEIGHMAFANCTQLKNFELRNVSVIGDSAFSGSGLRSLVLSQYVTSLGSGALKGCNNLTEITFGRGIKDISSSLLQGCPNVRIINFAEGITSIGANAFANCTKITKVSLPDSLKTIGDRAFYNCSKLAEVEFGSGLESIGASAFYHCYSLEEAELPDGIKELGDYAFAWCNALERVSLGSALQSIGESCFYNDTALERVEMPDTVTSLGSLAFAYCSAMREIRLSNSLSHIGSNPLMGCRDLVFLNGVSTEFARYVMEYDLLGEGDLENTSYKYLKSGYTGYSSLEDNGYTYVPFEICYNLKEEYRSYVGKQIKIYLPQGASLAPETMKLNGKSIGGYNGATNAQYHYNYVVVNLNDYSGVLTFCVKPGINTNVKTYAEFSMKKSAYSATESEFIGYVSRALPEITLSAPETVSSDKVVVEGVAPYGRTIQFYVDGVRKGSIQSPGSYRATLTLPSAKEYQKYLITAEVMDPQGKIHTADAVVKYESQTPALTSFYLYYGQNGYKKSGYQLLNRRYRLTLRWGDFWWGSGRGYSYYFDVSLSNTHLVDKVYVVSSRNGKKEYLEAKWNGRNYRTSGYFANDCEYVPGTLTVEYTKKGSLMEGPIRQTLSDTWILMGKRRLFRRFLSIPALRIVHR